MILGKVEKFGSSIRMGNPAQFTAPGADSTFLSLGKLDATLITTEYIFIKAGKHHSVNQLHLTHMNTSFLSNFWFSGVFPAPQAWHLLMTSSRSSQLSSRLRGTPDSERTGGPHHYVNT